MRGSVFARSVEDDVDLGVGDLGLEMAVDESERVARVWEADWSEDRAVRHTSAVREYVACAGSKRA